MMFTERNARWADWIAGRMQTPGTVFVAVGAGHLAGKDSVLVEARRTRHHLRRGSTDTALNLRFRRTCTRARASLAMVIPGGVAGRYS